MIYATIESSQRLMIACTAATINLATLIRCVMRIFNWFHHAAKPLDGDLWMLLIDAKATYLIRRFLSLRKLFMGEVKFVVFSL